MGHNITAVIGPRQSVHHIAQAAGCPTPTALDFGLTIAPLGHRQIDRLTGLQPGRYIDGFAYLSGGLQDALLTAMGGGILAYFETNYSGGTGSQAAAVFSAGDVVMQAVAPVRSDIMGQDAPINAALRIIGVKASAGQDEFSAIGLGRFRDLGALGLENWDDD